jgi:hypothetical protein
MEELLQIVIDGCIACMDALYHLRHEWMLRRSAWRRDQAIAKIRAIGDLQIVYLELQREQAQRVFEQAMKHLQSRHD